MPGSKTSQVVYLAWARELCGDSEGERSPEELSQRLVRLPAQVLSALGPGMHSGLVHALKAHETDAALALISVWPAARLASGEHPTPLDVASEGGPPECLEAIVERMDDGAIDFSNLLVRMAFSRAIPAACFRNILGRVEEMQPTPKRWCWLAVSAAGGGGRLDVVSALLDCTAPREPMSEYDHPLDGPAGYGSVEVLELLLERVEALRSPAALRRALVVAVGAGKGEATAYLLSRLEGEPLPSKALALAAVGPAQLMGAWGPLEVVCQRLPLDSLLATTSGRNYVGQAFHVMRLPRDLLRLVEISPPEALAAPCDDDGRTALMLAVSSPRGGKVAAALVQKLPRAALTVQDKLGRTALDHCVDPSFRSLLQPRVKAAATCKPGS